MSDSTTQRHDHWPDLPFDEWRRTVAILHMWTRIIGRIPMVHFPTLALRHPRPIHPDDLTGLVPEGDEDQYTGGSLPLAVNRRSWAMMR